MTLDQATFLDMTPKTQATKGRTEKLDLKIRNSGPESSEKTTSRMGGDICESCLTMTVSGP